MRIDAHQHYWSTAHADYGWLRDTAELACIYRDFGPTDLHPLLDAAGIAATVLVQAAPSEAETWRLLEIAARPGSRVLGVVGWCDLLAADAPARIDRLSRQPLLKGLRPMLQDLPDPRWILQPPVQPALDTIEARCLAFDALIKGPAQLEGLIELVRQRPGLRVVLDHAGKPAIATGTFDDWAAGMERLARAPQLMCKLSGLVSEAAPGWQVDDLVPYVRHLLDTFGPQRLIWGSDWPVLNLASGYQAWRDATDELLRALDHVQRQQMLGGNAMRFYRLDSLSISRSGKRATCRDGGPRSGSMRRTNSEAN